MENESNDKSRVKKRIEIILVTGVLKNYQYFLIMNLNIIDKLKSVQNKKSATGFLKLWEIYKNLSDFYIMQNKLQNKKFTLFPRDLYC